LYLLANTEFNDGIVAGVPGSVIVAHKFGEREDEVTKLKNDDYKDWANRVSNKFRTILLTLDPLILTSIKEQNQFDNYLSRIGSPPNYSVSENDINNNRVFFKLDDLPGRFPESEVSILSNKILSPSQNRITNFKKIDTLNEKIYDTLEELKERFKVSDNFIGTAIAVAIANNGLGATTAKSDAKNDFGKLLGISGEELDRDFRIAKNFSAAFQDSMKQQGYLTGNHNGS
jgi:hypothetical protein